MREGVWLWEPDVSSSSSSVEMSSMMRRVVEVGLGWLARGTIGLGSSSSLTSLSYPSYTLIMSLTSTLKVPFLNINYVHVPCHIVINWMLIMSLASTLEVPFLSVNNVIFKNLSKMLVKCQLQVSFLKVNYDTWKNPLVPLRTSRHPYWLSLEPLASTFP